MNRKLNRCPVVRPAAGLQASEDTVGVYSACERGSAPFFLPSFIGGAIRRCRWLSRPGRSESGLARICVALDGGSLPLGILPHLARWGLLSFVRSSARCGGSWLCCRCSGAGGHGFPRNRASRGVWGALAPQKRRAALARLIRLCAVGERRGGGLEAGSRAERSGARLPASSPEPRSEPPRIGRFAGSTK